MQALNQKRICVALLELFHSVRLQFILQQPPQAIQKSCKVQTTGENAKSVIFLS